MPTIIMRTAAQDRNQSGLDVAGLVEPGNTGPRFRPLFPGVSDPGYNEIVARRCAADQYRPDASQSIPWGRGAPAARADTVEAKSRGGIRAHHLHEAANFVVVLVADDMGFADCGVYGGRDIPTPAIDALARNGVRFRHAYTSGCVCSPTRAGLMTGRYQNRFGFDANAEGRNPADKGPRALDRAQVTMAQRLKPLGYATALIGKWHLGAEPGYLPHERGFDEFYGFLPYGIAAQGPKGPPIHRGATIVETPANHMEQFCAEALAFIDRRQREPFFLYLPFPAVHGPMVGAAPWLERVGPRVPSNRRKYAADLIQLDDVIGRVMTRLRDRGLEEHTLVFFFSDNGGAGGPTDNGPLRGTKWMLWEGGIHVPFIVQWKGRIPAGRVLDHPIIQLDVLPTAVAAAGGVIPPEWKLEGANLLPVLEGRSTVAPHAALYWRFGVQYAVRQGDWKLVKPHVDAAPRLVNLAQDLGEQQDLAAREPARARQLQALWDAWNAANEPPRWIDVRWNGDGPRPKAGAGKKAGGTKKSGPRF